MFLLFVYMIFFHQNVYLGYTASYTALEVDLGRLTQ